MVNLNWMKEENKEWMRDLKQGDKVILVHRGRGGRSARVTTVKEITVGRKVKVNDSLTYDEWFSKGEIPSEDPFVRDYLAEYNEANLERFEIEE